MRTYSGTELDYLQGRGGYSAHALLWVRPRDITTNARASFGFWTGDQDSVFTIRGENRGYTGGGALTALEMISMQTGVVVRMQQVTLSALFDEVAQLLRGYDAWRAPVEIHRALFNTDTGALVAEPRQLWAGVTNTAPIQTPAIGGEAVAELTLASAAESLTHGMTLTKSDAVQRLRSDDRFRRYKDVSGAVTCSWGELRK